MSLSPWARAASLLFWAAIGWVAPGSTALAAGAARITILEGEASVVDGARQTVAIEGQPLAPRSLVRTGERLNLLRIEWPDGTAADLGPGTRAMVDPGRLARGEPAPALYLLEGWAKLSSLGKAETPGQQSPALQLLPFKGVAVSFVSSQQAFVFAESGRLGGNDRAARPAAPFTLKAGQTYTRGEAGDAGVAERASPQQLGSVPRGFRESLPLRSARFTQDPALPPPSVPTYAELAPWLTAEPALRRDFTRRFRPLLRDAAFRKALDANLSAHPEWRPVLYPPPPPPPPSAPRPATR